MCQGAVGHNIEYQMTVEGWAGLETGLLHPELL